MEKRFISMMGMLMICLLVITTFSNNVSATGPTVKIKHYKNNKNFQYAVISGTKYKNANAKMLKYTKTVYQANAKLQTRLKKDLKAGRAMKGMKYWSTVSCRKRYNTTNKTSILCINDTYDGGAHGMPYVKSFNLYKGKVIRLKSAFKSESNYTAGKKYAKNYMLNHPNNYPFADQQTTIAGHSFIWTKKGLQVVFDPYEVASFAGGIKYVPVPGKYLKK
ncbi:RsiV family protein [Rummeliibacillus suwonensis]|uniref:RsiV family protein n=1 Tax=Rummeliibacillus suwonensis TaxID=1306154 RepID=UPI0011B44889|nr:RsiV family protein [Rummeliibacillus suwonensis]